MDDDLHENQLKTKSLKKAKLLAATFPERKLDDENKTIQEITNRIETNNSRNQAQTHQNTHPQNESKHSFVNPSSNKQVINKNINNINKSILLKTNENDIMTIVHSSAAHKATNVSNSRLLTRPPLSSKVLYTETTLKDTTTKPLSSSTFPKTQLSIIQPVDSIKFHDECISPPPSPPIVYINDNESKNEDSSSPLFQQVINSSLFLSPFSLETNKYRCVSTQKKEQSLLLNQRKGEKLNTSFDKHVNKNNIDIDSNIDIDIVIDNDIDGDNNDDNKYIDIDNNDNSDDNNDDNNNYNNNYNNTIPYTETQKNSILQLDNSWISSHKSCDTTRTLIDLSNHLDEDIVELLSDSNSNNTDNSIDSSDSDILDFYFDPIEYIKDNDNSIHNKVTNNNNNSNNKVNNKLNKNISSEKTNLKSNQDLSLLSHQASDSIQPPLPLSTYIHDVLNPRLDALDPNPDITLLFRIYNKQFFNNTLSSVYITWSKRMTLCAGICRYKSSTKECIISLSQPLLQYRPRGDTVNTLLHEMIHAYLFISVRNTDHSDHGPLFQHYMRDINNTASSNITVYHTFHDEVRQCQQHVWKCDGPCVNKPPYFGIVRRSMNRPPQPADWWFANHQKTCGGTFHKISEPKKVNKTDKTTKKNVKAIDIRSLFIDDTNIKSNKENKKS
ncbi:hypothetical protein WA158_002711 [Blastocystis sp. Blastoise]